MKNILQKLSLFLCLVLTCFMQLMAQSPRLYTTQQGLPSTRVLSMTMDRENFLWICTEQGLVRFDGQTFFLFNAQENNPYALRDSHVNCLFEDAYNNHWVGTSDGIYYFCRMQNKFVQFRLSNDGNARSVSAMVMHPYKNNILLACTYGYGIYAFNVEKREVDSLLTQQFQQAYLKGHFKNMLIDKKGVLWSIHGTGLSALSLKDMKQMDIQASDDIKEMVEATVFDAICEDRKYGCVYFASSQNGLFVYDQNTGILSRAKNKNLQTLPTTRLLLDLDSKLLIGTENAGLYVYDQKNDVLELKQFVNCPVDLKHCKIHNMIYDDQDNLWLVLYQKGVLIVPKTDRNFAFNMISDKPNGENLGCVTSFQTLPNGSHAVGMDGGGLIVKSLNGKCDLFSKENGDFASNSVLDLLLVENDILYIATFNDGVYAYKDGKVFRPKGLESLSSSRVMCLEYDSIYHNLYIGTNGGGIYVYNTISKVCKFYEKTNDLWITFMEMGPSHTLFVGTAIGFYSIDLDTSEILRYKMPVSKIVRSMGLYIDGDSVLWYACSEGLIKYNLKDKEPQLISIDTLFHEQNVVSVVKGVDNNIWFSTTDAIGRFDPRLEQLHIYASDDVALVGNFNPRSVISDEHGNIAFGGDNGIVTFNPLKVIADKTPIKELYFSDLWVENVLTEYDPSSKSNMLDAALWHARTLTIPSEKNSFSINYSVQEYSNPKGMHYSYRLLGYDEAWHEVHGMNHSANYSNIPTGQYNFQVRAYGNDGELNKPSFKQLRVIVLAPWYATWWAWGIYVLALAASAYFLIRFIRIRRMEKKKMLRIQHQEQVKEAKLRLFTSISHDIKTPLMLILSPLKKLMEKKNDNNTRNSYELMYRNAMRIMMLVNQQMDIRKIDNGQLHLKMRELMLKSSLEDVMQYFVNVAALHHVQFSLQMQDCESLKIWADDSHFDKIFFNLLSNAFKFTHDQGEVIIRVQKLNNNGLLPDSKVSDCVKIVVYNSGSSVAESDIQHIFERFYQGKGTASDYVGTGIGLNLAKQLVELHHGAISVRNVEGAGVEFSTILPLGRAHLTEGEIATEKAADALSGTSNTLSQDMKINLDEMKSQEACSLELQPKALDVDEPNKPQSSESAMEESQEQQDAAKEDAQKDITMLLVDDDEDFLLYLRNELKEYKIILATSGENAWCQLLTNAPDVVVTDLKMPNGDGLALCKRIKNNPDTYNMPVIVLTSENTEDIAVEAVKCQADRFLSKPVNMSLLRGAIIQSLKVRENVLNKLRRTDLGYDYHEVKMDSADEKLLQKVIEVVRANLSDSDFSVEELSKKIGISRVHLNRKLKDLLGVSPSIFIKSIRLKQAAFLLVNSDVTISEIAYAVGFSTPSYFTTTFTSYFNMSPKEFIANYKANPDDETLKKLLE